MEGQDALPGDLVDEGGGAAQGEEGGDQARPAVDEAEIGSEQAAYLPIIPRRGATPNL